MSPPRSSLHHLLSLALLSLPFPAASNNTNQPTYPPPTDHGEICTWNLPAGGGAFPPLLPIRPSCPVPIDNRNTAASSFAPWSHKPYCQRPAQLPKGSSPRKLCVYTSTPYRSGHGLSLLTTPQHAATLADSLDDSLVNTKLRDHPASSMAPTAAADQRAYTVRDLPGRGKGVVAVRDIPKWEVVLVGYPAVLARMDYAKMLSREQAVVMLGRAVGQLPRSQQREVWALTGGGEARGDERIAGIMKANIFGLEVDGVSHMGLYPEGSRVNHNCQPNTFWRSSPRTLTMEVVAMRDIKAGEEITHSYAPLGRPYEERKMILSQWNFTCSCALCSQHPEQRARSDRRRDRIWEVYLDLSQSATIIGRQLVDERVDELLGLIGTEALWPQLVEYYQVIARAYMALEELGIAKGFVEKAEQTWIQYGGVDHDGVEDIRKLWEEFGRAKRGEVTQQGQGQQGYDEELDGY